MSQPMRTALFRAAAGGLAAALGAALAAIEAGTTPRQALGAGLGALIVYLTARGGLEGVIDSGRARA